MKPIAPYATVTKSTIQMYGLEMSAHKIVGMTMATLMRMPPMVGVPAFIWCDFGPSSRMYWPALMRRIRSISHGPKMRSEEHTSELQSRRDLVCRLLLEKKKNKT